MTRLPGPGSFLWLVGHDLRLNWRRFLGMFGSTTPLGALAMGTIGILGLHALAWPIVPRLAPYFAGEAITPQAQLSVGAFLVCVASWMCAQGLFAATRGLYDRGDLDLLLGSPLPRRRILAGKVTAIALSSLGSVAILSFPVANVGALRNGAHWLAVYPTLAATALAATAFSLMATVGLFYLFGPRRARLYAQLGGAVIGGSFVLGVQIAALLPERIRDKLTAALAPVPADARTPLQSALWLPVDAMQSDITAMIALLCCAAAMFVTAIWAFGPRFAEACLDAAGAPSGVAAVRHRRPLQFRSGIAASLRRKEWRLLMRDPSMFAQLGLQIIYTIPLAVVLVRSGSLPLAVALTPAIVVIAAQVAASLAWIAVSGEDAPELIASAPVPPATVDAAKLSAIAAPVLLISIVPVAGLALASTRAAIIALVFATGASISTSLLNLWHPMPGNRRGMLRRHSQSKYIGLLEHLLAILWAIAAVLAFMGTGYWAVPVVLAAGVLGHRRMTSAVGDPARASSAPPSAGSTAKGVPAVH